MKKPVRLLASNTSLLNDMLVTLSPPFKPNFTCAVAVLTAMSATASISIVIIFLITILNYPIFH